MSFRLVPKTVTLNDLERRNGGMAFISKRRRITLRLLYAMSRPSVVCLSVVCLLSVSLSVCLSVCDVGAPYSGG